MLAERSLSYLLYDSHPASLKISNITIILPDESFYVNQPEELENLIKIVGEQARHGQLKL